MFFVETGILFGFSVVAFLGDAINLIGLDFHDLLFFGFEKVFKLDAFHGVFPIFLVHPLFLGNSNDEIF